MPIERVTLPLLIVIAALLERPSDEHHGYELAKRTALSGARVHQILTRLESAGWATSRLEAVDPKEAGRPRRRLYRLEANGVRAAEQLLAAHGHRLRAPAELGLQLRRPATAILGSDA